MMHEPIPSSADNPTSGKSEHIKAPEGGTPNEVKKVINAPLPLEKSETVPKIEDISGEVNADIKKGAKAEKKQELEDEKNGLDFEVTEDTDANEFYKETSHKGLFLFCGVAIVSGYFLLKNKIPNISEAQIQTELDNGTDTEVKIDKNGMIG